jgi:site-specific DNA recombinase
MKLYEALNDDLIDRDEYEKMRNKYTGMIEETENIIRQLSADREKSLTNTTPRDWMASIAKFKGITALSREAVITLVDRIYVYEDKHIRIDFNFRNELAYYKEILQQKEVV